MKELLLKRKSKFFLYVVACFLPIISDLLRTGVFALFFGAIEQQDRSSFVRICIYAGIYVLLGFFIYLASRMLRIGFMRDVVLEIRKKAFRKIIRTSYKEFSKKSKDMYISNLVNDINTFESEFFVNLIRFIYHTGTYVISLLIIAYLDLYLAGFLFVFSIIMYFIINKFQKKTIKLQQDVSSQNEDYTLNMANTFNGLEILKLNNIEEKFLDKSYGLIEELEGKKFKFRFFSHSQNNFSSTMGNLVFLLTLTYLLTRMNIGDSNLGFGIIAFIIQISINVVFSLSEILPKINVIKSSEAIYNKITKQDEQEKKSLTRFKKFIFNNKIEVKDLYFNHDEKEVLKGVSFNIEKGKKYLIKGASGVGKSTLMKLLSLTFDDYKGQITIDGLDYKAINENSFNESVAFVYQDVFLFEDTIKNNITLFKDLGEERVMDSVNKAGLKDFVDEKKDGVYSFITENGKNLSGGERQRISIARAIVKDADILFVDEGTSALNEELGREIEKTFLSLDKTVISISHRYYEGISERYDYVIEIKNGRIEVYASDVYFGEVVYV
ncbi:ABC transporter ATP-binding protein [Mycoplasmatota bacterium zrk1]